MAIGVSEPSIASVVILDNEGERIAAKYFASKYSTLASQKEFEKSLIGKAQKSNVTDEADIVIFDGHITVFRGSKDCYFFVTGDQDENEIILVDVLSALFKAVSDLAGNDRRALLDRLELVLLTIDELVDGGCILEIEASAIVNRVGMRTADADAPSATGAMHAQTPQEAMKAIKDQFTRSFFKGSGGGSG